MLAWLNEWDLQSLPWRLWEEVSALKLEKNSPLPIDFALVERGHSLAKAVIRLCVAMVTSFVGASFAPKQLK